MKKVALYIGFFLLFGPQIALAQSTPCSSQGYTVVFINGVFDTLDQAKADAKELQKSFGNKYNNELINFQVGYNPTHLAGAGDLAQSLAQEFNHSVSDYDLQTILMQTYPEVTTRKLLLVGHSQGAYYTNEMYDYLLAHGEPKEAMNVYDVATPASNAVAGGKYLNSSNDVLLTYLHDVLHFNELPTNVEIPLAGVDVTSAWPGHSFVGAYLTGAADRVVSDISGELSALVPTYPAKDGGCFTPPDPTFGYKTESAIFAVADPSAVLIKEGSIKTVQGVVAIGNAVTSGIGFAVNYFSNLIPTLSANVTDDAHTEINFGVVKKLYGSSLDTNDVKNLLGDSQGGAVALALTNETTKNGLVEGTSTIISNISTSTPISTPPIVAFVPGASSPTQEWMTPPSESISAPDATTTDATTTMNDVPLTDDIPTPPVYTPPTGAPVIDSFDSYDGSGWSVWPTPNNTIILFGADTGAADIDKTDPSIINDCHSGSCVIALGGIGGLGTFGYESSMYKESGVGQSAGAFTIWARARAGWHRPAVNIGLCAGENLGCSGENLFWYSDVESSDNTWHEFYIAWRQGADAVETCLLQDETSSNDCSWTSTPLLTGTQVDGVAMQGGVARPDLGDQVWFDDLENAPN